MSSEFSYNKFLEAVKSDGLARQNRFYIDLAMPSLTGTSAINFSSTGNNNKNLHLFCKSVQVPGVNVTSSSIRTHGEVFEAPYDRNFGAATLTFYVDRNMYVRQFFDDWINSVQNPNSRNIGYYEEFISSRLIIFVLDKADRINYYTILWDVQPKTISGLQLDQGNNEVMTLDVTLDYRYYISQNIPQPNISGGGGSSDEYDDFGETSPGKLMTTGVGKPYLPVSTNTLTSRPSSIGSGGSGGNGTTSSTSGGGGGGSGSSVINQARQAIGGGSSVINQAIGGGSSIINQAQQFKNTIGSSFGTVKNAIAGYQNDFLSFQRSISQGLGVVNSVGHDIRSIINAPKDALNSAKSTMRDVKSGIQGFKNVFKIF